MIKYFRYSGASITISLNPFYWRVLPWFYKEYTGWDDKTYCFTFLFLTVRIWIDNGEW